jgi:hypothetical protein
MSLPSVSRNPFTASSSLLLLSAFIRVLTNSSSSKTMQPKKIAKPHEFVGFHECCGCFLSVLMVPSFV